MNEELKQSESIKLIKNTKGYNWELKIIGSGENNTFTDEDLRKLDYLNKQLKEKYGGEE